MATFQISSEENGHFSCRDVRFFKKMSLQNILLIGEVWEVLKLNTELILSIVTIGISVIALYISISTAKKQNKIALFEKKLECYNDLSQYFEGKSIFSSAEVKLMEGNVKFKNGFMGNKDHLLSQVRLLFKKKIWDLTSEIDELYKLIHRSDSMISDYFSLLEEYPDGIRIKEEIKKYNEMEARDWQFPITTQEETEFKKMCDDNTIVYNNPVDGDTRLNYYDLKSIQKEAYQDISVKEKLLFELMENEIKI